MSSEQNQPPPRRFVGYKSISQIDNNQKNGQQQIVEQSKNRPKRFILQQVPLDITNNEELNRAISVLPANYNFEVHKTIWRLRQTGVKTVALQFPEGLLMFSCVLADIFYTFADIEDVIILGDPTYGACCIDDFSSKSLGADFLIHYGHSCLVPVTHTTLPCMYVFVDINIDLTHMVSTIIKNFEKTTKLIVAGTIQFAAAIQRAKEHLSSHFESLRVPQTKPLSPGEVLGCTSPVLNAEEVDAIVFVSDGRFHLESIMISNPNILTFRYDPYARTLSVEEYDQEGMRFARWKAIESAQTGKRFGLILGTLGRQGNPRVFETLSKAMDKKNLEYSMILMPEVLPDKLAQLTQFDAFVQVACPRLSIDWGEGFKKPTLTPYEMMIVLGEVRPWWEDGNDYPMDYYQGQGGEWSSSYHTNRKQPK